MERIYELPYNNEKTSSYEEYEIAWKNYWMFRAEQSYKSDVNLYWNDGNTEALQEVTENKEEEIKKKFNFYYNNWKDKQSNNI